MNTNSKTATETASGSLFVVATPIGNLEDISLRALRILKEADLIACEDTRQTIKLLSHFDIHKRLVSYHEHNEITRAPEIVIELEQGAKVALVTDAGTPAVSDPGSRLVSLCVRHGIAVVPIPGASAFVTALAGSGLPVEEFSFLGFLPSRQSQRRKTLRTLVAEARTLIFYEAPHRLLDTLEDALEILGNRPAVIARELTKVHEEFQRGHMADLLDAVRKKAPRGEITLIIGPADGLERTDENQALSTVLTPLAQRVDELMKAENIDQKAALKKAARERGLTRREAYKQLLITRDESSS
jgi:16S rRNA (cytidine1402-2'-O)-methyltransferase